MAKSFQDFDKPYRRGLVLGLSLAELFLILLFLLLLVSMGISSQAEIEKEELRQQVASLQDDLAALKKIVGNEITAEDFQDLIKHAKETKQLKEENKELKDKLATQEKLAQELQNELQNKIDQLQKRNELIDELSKKGQDPPCWFVTVADPDEIDGKRQKHIKIFDVLIEDSGFQVRLHDNSSNSLPIEKGNINNLPAFPEDKFNTSLSTDEFYKAFTAFKRVGEEKQIHDYRCRFMVDVFDNTSIDNKKGYKYNLGTVENLFYKFEERSKWK